jgi:hypothetical protein
MTPMQRTVLEVGDPRRARAGRAVLECLATATLVLGFVFVTKEARPLSVHTPWADDPFDVFVSFAIFFLPLLVALALVRVPLCRAEEPLPASRLEGLLRVSNVAVAVVIVTLAALWVSVLLRVRESDWNTVTVALLAVLMLVTLVAIRAAFDLWRGRRAIAGRVLDATGPDWLADSLTLAIRVAQRGGVLADPLRRMVRFADRVTTVVIRPHPLASAAVFSVAFGAAVAAAAAREEGLGTILLIFFGVATCGMFAFVVAIGSYVGLVHRDRAFRGVSRRLADASVAGAAAVPIALAFRDSLWWTIGARPSNAGVESLAVLVGLAGIATFAVALTAETLLRVHAEH